MPSTYPIAPQAPAVRGQVQRIFNDIKVLAGFTDPNHLMSIISEYFNTLDLPNQQPILQNADAARRYVAALTPLATIQTEIRPITHAYIQTIINDPIFKAAFGAMQYRFCYINPAQIIALQPWIEPRNDPVPTDELELLKFALPNEWDIPAEINFIQPLGPIQILSSNPMFQNLSIEFDGANGKVSLGPPKHLNLTQIKHFQGKYYLFNGYHRMADAIRTGVVEYPCLMIEVFSPAELMIPDPRFFNFGYVSGLFRPPLVSDFGTQASILSKARERRYGMIVSLDIKPINIGI
jgi:hypothetical protein